MVDMYIRFKSRKSSDKDNYCPEETFILTYDAIKKMSVKQLYELCRDEEIDKRDYNWDNEY